MRPNEYGFAAHRDFAWFNAQVLEFFRKKLASDAEDAPTTVIGDVTVISPERASPLEHAYVRIERGRMAQVSRRPLKGNLRIDGRGKFLIPGLIDSHTHLGQVPGMQPMQLSAHPDLAAQAQTQEPHSYLYFGFTTVLSLGDMAPSIERWNTLAVRPDAYFCGATPMFNGYSFRGLTASPYFLFNADQASPAPVNPAPNQRFPMKNALDSDIRRRGIR